MKHVIPCAFHAWALGIPEMGLPHIGLDQANIDPMPRGAHWMTAKEAGAPIFLVLNETLWEEHDRI